MLWNAMQIRSDIIWCLWLVIGYIWSCNPTDNRRWFAGLAISYLQSSLVLFRLWSVLALRLIALSFLIPRKSIMSSISLNLRPTDPPEIVEDKNLYFMSRMWRFFLMKLGAWNFSFSKRIKQSQVIADEFGSWQESKHKNKWRLWSKGRLCYRRRLG